ncbi:hypothetical protein DE146DRAFT_497463 [Phaeosphaeria sp. MPI-PUGE-AT-0046c]|nr:hypothetical protein DE146DRAFT_497463 [Phaeosphaeria sp. MPI-PUGE-AT-0046c]
MAHRPFGPVHHSAPPPPPPACDDRPHCAAVGAGPCAATILPCGQIRGAAAPDAYSGRQHGAGVSVCTTCLGHGVAERQRYIDGLAGPRVHGPGPSFLGLRTKLCKSCVRDEMSLYWSRVGTARPVVGSAWQSTAWPTHGMAPANAQDLCTCRHRAMPPLVANNCHACRDDFFDATIDQQRDRHDAFLRERTSKVIKGQSQCVLNGGTAQHLVPPNTQAARIANGDVRACPCGEKPMRLRPGQPEFISICLCCMGVRVDPAHIPPEYQRQALQRRRPETRSQRALNNALPRTKGPAAAPRDGNFRVNIELGFLNTFPPLFHDYFIGGV